MDLGETIVTISYIKIVGARLTLFSFVRPLIGHSLTSSGASIEVEFAPSMKGSLMMFTVNPLVALILAAVSLRPRGPLLLQLIETTGGW